MYNDIRRTLKQFYSFHISCHGVSNVKWVLLVVVMLLGVYYIILTPQAYTTNEAVIQTCHINCKDDAEPIIEISGLIKLRELEDIDHELKDRNNQSDIAKEKVEDSTDLDYGRPPDDLIKTYFGDAGVKSKLNIHKIRRGQPQQINKVVPFGNPKDFECGEEYCFVNGKQIKKALINENPRDMFTFIPPEDKFFKEFRNPCWKGEDLEGNSRLFCLPYFYIIGFTKCGTTDLYWLLKNHTLIFSRAGKETHYFDRIRRGRSKRMNRKPDRDPVSLMAFANDHGFRAKLLSTYKKTEGRVLFHGITMDATPAQIWDNEYWEFFHPEYREPPVTSADVIHTLTPQAKIIVSLRDPIKRMQSAYQFFCAHNVYKCDYPITNVKFHNLVEAAVDNFRKCLMVNTVRGCTYSTENHQLATHLYASIYFVYLKDWLALFPRDQIHVMMLEEHIEDEQASVNSICDFLDIPRFPQDDLKRLLASHDVRNELAPEKKIPYILPETMSLLKDFFRPFNRELKELLGGNKAWYSDE